ncbi:helix-turn-helix protein [Herbihabitans rhizosphaerae]|uniref:Helix-turn-helix protein n=1 Tax=Herbihabitans rhizosphaerae TaxID=1872711 RepID=A0A4Q7KY35_9PSEU|nr:helix-turn-helix transcriptional regulator [Herbihabitans rhizosphaerae]RZS41270.1 helix-turn-helix protein [Herbihabitans rhizosphaerae]
MARDARPFLRRKLGRQLRQMREGAGKKIKDAAKVLDMSTSALQRLEAGEVKPNIHVVKSMMDYYDHFVDGLLDQVRQARVPVWTEAFVPMGLGYVDVETEANLVRELTLMHLPGLLQTEAYARALFRKSLMVRSAAQRDNEVKVRMIRQRRLSDDQRPLELVAIVDESAFHVPVGGTEVMRAQLEKVASAADLPSVTLQVLPRSLGGHGGMRAPFALLSFPDPNDPVMLYAPYVNGARLHEDEDEAREALSVFDHLRSEALDPAASVALIERLADELYGA